MVSRNGLACGLKMSEMSTKVNVKKMIVKKMVV